MFFWVHSPGLGVVFASSEGEEDSGSFLNLVEPLQRGRDPEPGWQQESQWGNSVIQGIIEYFAYLGLRYRRSWSRWEQ